MANYYHRSKAYVAFQVRLSPDLKEKLSRRAFETGQSQVAIVNEALERYFSEVVLGTGAPETEGRSTDDEEGG